MSRRIELAVVLLSAAAAACGDGEQASSTNFLADAGAGAAPAPSGGGGTAATRRAAALRATLPALGVDAPTRFAWDRGPGARDHRRAVAAYRATPRDWIGTRSAAAAAIAADPGHLEAHRLLAAALAAEGRHGEATEHLAVALVGDWLRWGPTLAGDPDLAGYLASPEGAVTMALVGQLGAEVHGAIATGALVVARRAPWALPDRAGVQPATSQGELYAYDADGDRWLRLTHTDHQVAAWLRSADGRELALVGYDRVMVPRWGSAEAPTIARAWVEIVDAASLEPLARRARFADVTAIELGYGAGGELLVTTTAAADATATTWSIDRSTGAVNAATAQPVAARVVASLADVSFERPLAFVDDVGADWTGAPPIAAELELPATGVTVELPDDTLALESSLAWSPARARLALATAADPCATNPGLAAATLYVADAATGELHHVATAASRFVVTWLDDERLLYEDGDGGLRLWDAGRGVEIRRLALAGVGVHGVASATAPSCSTP